MIKYTGKLEDFISPKEFIESRGLGLYGKVQKQIDSSVIRRTDPYVPYYSGELARSANLATAIGSGSGDGSGYSDGRGSGIKSFNGQTVHIIDNVPTIITRIVNNLAKGFILESDFTLTPCFIAKGQNVFAHGKTAAEAMRALRDKIFENMDVGEKIKAFLKEVSLVQKYPAKFFYDWHHKLTGSCEMGRNRFVRDHNIDLENGEYTVREFIEITENDYGGDIIRRLKERISDI